ncbi:MAG: ATP cone domain-containing protein, partial [Gammaproteobacteria bacterium]
MAPGALQSEVEATAPGEFRVIRRNGKVTTFDEDKIKIAMTKAFLAVEGGNAAASTRVHETVADLATGVVRVITRRMPSGGAIHIEDIQDQVELALMRAGQHKIARAYVLYREDRARERQRKSDQAGAVTNIRRSALHVTRNDGTRVALDEARLRRIVTEACQNLSNTEPDLVLAEAMRSLFDGVAEGDVAKALVMSARTFIEREPNYTYVAARMLLDSLRIEALSFVGNQVTAATQFEMGERYPHYFEAYVKR